MAIAFQLFFTIRC